jgi:hypothetical protein
MRNTGILCSVASAEVSISIPFVHVDSLALYGRIRSGLRKIPEPAPYIRSNLTSRRLLSSAQTSQDADRDSSALQHQHLRGLCLRHLTQWLCYNRFYVRARTPLSRNARKRHHASLLNPCRATWYLLLRRQHGVYLYSTATSCSRSDY